MKKIRFFPLLLAVFTAALLQAKVEQSTKSTIEHLFSCDLSQYPISEAQSHEVHTLIDKYEQRIRVASYNMLFKQADDKVPSGYQWKDRRWRIIAFFSHWQPDIVGSQELTDEQVNFLRSHLEQDYYLLGAEKEWTNPLRNAINENAVVFVKKARFQVEMFQALPYEDGPSPENYFVHGTLVDKQTGESIHILNTHLSYLDSNRRTHQARQLAQYIHHLEQARIIITGDFNTFPTRFEEPSLPFIDGSYIEHHILEKANLVDSRNTSLLGHFGPLSSSNYNPKTGQNFEGHGSPGAFLDHIYTSPEITTLFHTADPFQVDGYYASDHLPLIADLFLPSL